MKKKIKLLFNILPISFAVLSLTGCTNKDMGINNQPPDNSGIKDDVTVNETEVQKTLTISDYKCTGCGKCVRVDSEHFSIDYASRASHNYGCCQAVILNL
jgi:NAD-dependent dihydropyrimidine dehydrogenase PreA subunit